VLVRVDETRGGDLAGDVDGFGGGGGVYYGGRERWRGARRVGGGDAVVGDEDGPAADDFKGFGLFVKGDDGTA